MVSCKKLRQGELFVIIKRMGVNLHWFSENERSVLDLNDLEIRETEC